MAAASIRFGGGIVTRRVVVSAGQTGYRHQLDRTRRFLERIEESYEELGDMDPVVFQDNMWSFFQHCWHVKDWVRNDPIVPQATKDLVVTDAEQSRTLTICQDLCNGTKHLKLRTPQSGAGASTKHIEMTIAPEVGRLEMDCIVDDGNGKDLSGKALARDCLKAWEQILINRGLATGRLS